MPGRVGEVDETVEVGQAEEADQTDDIGIAGSRSRRSAAEVAPPSGPLGVLKFAWAVLTSMRTAILLLLALAVAAIPGGLLPQRRTNPFSTTQWITDHPTVGPWLDKIGMFDVYHAPWFAAIYLLLFVSLVGCIVPRVAVYARAFRAPAASPPRALGRMASARRYGTTRTADDVLSTAETYLRKKHFRVRRIGNLVAAEKGYLRELGNLSFHVALLGVLVAIGYGNLFGFTGTAVVVEGQGFSNTVTQYDDLNAGAGFKATDLQPFTVLLKDFVVKYETGPVQTGAAREFHADVTVTTPDGTREQTLQVNDPLRIGDTSVHLVGHGYAPFVTVRDGNGDVAFSGPVVFQPVDGNLKSVGVVNARDARPNRVALQGYFLPTAWVDDQGPRSLFPDTIAPELFLTAWVGPPATETGQPQSVFTLDTTGMTQLSEGNDPLRIRLSPGETYVLPGGNGFVTFQGYQQWTKLQISTNPGLPAVLGFVALSIVGMAISLAVRPRRVWLSAEVTDAGAAVTIAGVDRVDGRSGVGEDVVSLAEAVDARPEPNIPGPAGVTGTDSDDETIPQERVSP